jgi:glycine/D-amino acid oxidase-like deaminating enzyme
MTAYMLLMHTSHKVTLIEAKRLAHGATGHNAGQVAAYFEKPFDEIVEEY